MKDIASSVEATWERQCGKVCAGMNWELFPSVEDAKVFNIPLHYALRKYVHTFVTIWSRKWFVN